MKKTLFLITFCLVSTFCAFSQVGVVHDPQAAVQREKNFGQSIQTALENVRKTQEVVEAQKALQDVYQTVGSVFNSLSMLREGQSALNNINSNFNAIKSEINSNQALYDVEKYRMYEELTILLEKTVSKSVDLTSICSTDFKTDNANRLQALNIVVTDLKGIDKDMRTILAKSRHTSQKRTERSQINKMIFTGKF